MDFDSREEPEVIVLDEEDCSFDIVTVKIGENGAIEETNEPVINLDPQIHPINFEQLNDSSETDNSDDWTDDADSPANVTPVESKTTKRKRRKGPHSCSYCGKTFGQRLHLMDHIMTHTGEKPFKCIVCNKGFIQRSNLNTHISQRHPSEATRLKMDKITQSFNCWQCLRSFTNHSNYTKHMKAHIKRGEKQSSSVQLEETSNFLSSSDSDAQSASAEIAYSCAFCDQEYPDEESLASHMNFHTGDQARNSLISSEVHSEHQKHEDYGEEYSNPQSPDSYSCSYCGKQCTTKLSLSYHERTHRIKRMFRCAVCRRGFNKKQAFDRHIRIHFTNQLMGLTFNCKYCGKQFNTKLSWSYHERTHRIKRPFRCSLCNKGFSQREAYNRHIKLHSAKSTPPVEHQKEEETDEYLSPQSPQSLSCKYCGKQFSTEVSLSYHERTHRIKRMYRCSICRRGFNSRLAYDRHSRIHSAKTAVQTEHQKFAESRDEYSGQQSLKSFSCSYCGKKCDTEMKLSYHERTHRIQRSFRCSICKRGFDSEPAYARHMREHTVKPVQTEHQKEEETGENSVHQSEESFSCKYCGKQFTTAVSLSYHERTHRIQRTFRCFICRRGFNSKQVYDRHILQHQEGVESGDGYSSQLSSNPFFCNDCGARFSTELSLTEHEKTHRIQREFNCAVCNRGFNRRQTYERHIKMHSAKTAVKIEHQKDAMDEDSNQQSPESFSCKYCGKQCDTKLSLSYHERSHKVKRTFCCPVCSRGFDSRHVYYLHLRTHSSKTTVQTVLQKEEESLKSEMDNHSQRDPDPLKPLNYKEGGGQFREKTSLESHVTCTTVDIPFCCKFCNKKFASKAAWTVHMKSYNLEMPYSCSICNEKFKHSGRLALHMDIHETKSLEPFSCTVCDKTFTRRYTLKMHMARLHKKEKVFKPFRCKDCGERFSKRQLLSYHERAHKIKSPFCCSICKIGFIKREAYERHLRMHSAKHTNIKTEHLKEESSNGESAQQQPQSFRCKECGVQFGKMVSLEYHLRTHKIKFRFPCPICSRRFSRRQTYEEHMKIHTGFVEEADSTSTSDQSSNEETDSNTGEIIFSCPLCDTELSTEEELQTHMDHHEKIDPLQSYSCDKCGASFGEKKCLESHMEIHNDVTSMFCCNICNKTFTKGPKYESHMRLHTGERRYSCTICNKKFNRRSKLEEHTQVHEGMTPFSCSVCHEDFSSESNLKKHMRLHEGEDTSFDCDDCGKRYSSKLGLYYHKRTHNKNVFRRTFCCSVCNIGFDKRIAYEWHLKMHCPKVKNEQEEEDEGGEQSLVFRCEDCGAKFSENLSWELHKRTHQGNYPFHCSICKRGFKIKELYELHMNTHTSEEDLESNADLKELTCHMDSLGQPISGTADNS